MAEPILPPTLENVQVIVPEERDGYLLRRELRDRMVELKGLLLQEETEYRSLSQDLHTLQTAPPSPPSLQTSLDAFLAAHPDLQEKVNSRRRMSLSDSISDQDGQGEDLDDSDADGFADETMDGVEEEARRTQEEGDGVADYLLDVQDDDEDDEGEDEDDQDDSTGLVNGSAGLVDANGLGVSVSDDGTGSVPPRTTATDSAGQPPSINVQDPDPRAIDPSQVPSVPTVIPPTPLPITADDRQSPNGEPTVQASQGSDKSVVAATPSPPPGPSAELAVSRPSDPSQADEDGSGPSRLEYTDGLVHAPSDPIPTSLSKLDGLESPVASSSTLPVSRNRKKSFSDHFPDLDPQQGLSAGRDGQQATDENAGDEGAELDGQDFEEGLVKLEDFDDHLGPADEHDQVPIKKSKGKGKAAADHRETTADVSMDGDGDEDAEGETDGVGEDEEEEEEVAVPVEQRKGRSRSSAAVAEPTPAKTNKGKGHPKTKMPKNVAALANTTPSVKDSASDDGDREGSFLDGETASQASRQDSMAPSVASNGRSKSKGKTTKQRQDEKAAGLSEADAAEMHEKRKADRRARDQARRERSKGAQKPNEEEDLNADGDGEGEHLIEDDLITPAKRTTNKRKATQGKTKSPAPDADRATKKRREDLSVTPEGRARSSSRQASSRGPSSRPPNSLRGVSPSLPLPAPNPKLPPSKFKKAIEILLSGISQHRSSSIFQKPIQDGDAPNYSTTVLRPMDLKAIKARIKDGKIANVDEFERDILLMFTNAMLFNEPTSDIHGMADAMMVEAEKQIREWRHLQYRLITNQE